jgi:hypothetical protein
LFLLRRSWPSPPPSLPPSTTCSRTARCTKTSAATTSIAVQPISKSNAWSNASLNLLRCGDQAARRLEPCLWHRQQAEFVARSEQVCFFLAIFPFRGADGARAVGAPIDRSDEVRGHRQQIRKSAALTEGSHLVHLYLSREGADDGGRRRDASYGVARDSTPFQQLR